MTLLIPASDTSPAGWVAAGLRGFAVSVLSVVPAGFDTYVRVFHPAYRRAGDALVRVRWSEIAAVNGKQAHPAMNLNALTGDDRYDDQPGVFDFSPETGTLPPETLAPLTAVLGRHTTRPERCWFAVWHGWGGIRDDLSRAPTFDVPNRTYHLLSGPLAAAAEDVSSGGTPLVSDPWAAAGEGGTTSSGWGQSASLWWPDDHAWCVATEIDLNTTYVGCDADCRDEILALPELETYEIDPTSGITNDSDLLNRADR